METDQDNALKHSEERQRRKYRIKSNEIALESGMSGDDAKPDEPCSDSAAC
jgi:hypothetical protein